MLPKNIGLFCKTALQKRLYSAYVGFHWKCYTHEIHQIEKLRFLGISRY